MLNLFEPLKKLNKYQYGQLIFIFAITAGPFFSDTVRKVLFFLSIFCIDKAVFYETFHCRRDGAFKRYACTLIFFWACLILIPLVWGVDDVLERVRSIGWPLEMVLWMCAAQLFARDAFFIENIKKASICMCVLYSLIVIPFFISTNFVIDHTFYYAWPCSLASWSAGSIISCLSAWIIYQLFIVNGMSKWHSAMCSFFYVLTSFVMFMTLYVTFWVVMVAQILTILFVSVYLFRKRISVFIKKMIPIVGGIMLVFSMVFMISPKILTAIEPQYQQLLMFNKDVEAFTSKRNLVWTEAIGLIMERPLTGYGWAEYENFNKLSMGHTHSSFLQIAWTAGLFPAVLFIGLLLQLLYICIHTLKRSSPDCALPVVVILVAVAFFVNGTLDNLFNATRKVSMLYWIYLSLPLCKAFLINKFEGVDNNGE